MTLGAVGTVATTPAAASTRIGADESSLTEHQVFIEATADAVNALRALNGLGPLELRSQPADLAAYNDCLIAKNLRNLQAGGGLQHMPPECGTVDPDWFNYELLAFRAGPAQYANDPALDWYFSTGHRRAMLAPEAEFLYLSIHHYNSSTYGQVTLAAMEVGRDSGFPQQFAATGHLDRSRSVLENSAPPLHPDNVPSVRGGNLLPPANGGNLHDVFEAANLGDILSAWDYGDREANVLRLYRAFFSREPDVAGAQYWIRQTRRGASEDTLAYGFRESTEFRSVYGSLGDRQFLELLYRNMLGREADGAGLDYWLGRMRGGLSQHQVVRWVVANDEFVARYPYAPR